MWVGEEDHIKIIVMSQNWKLVNLYQIAEKVAAEIQRKSGMSYMFDDHLGYITCCPSKLGSTLHAAVHVCLPNLMYSKQKFFLTLNKYVMDVKALQGESIEFDDGLF